MPIDITLSMLAYLFLTKVTNSYTKQLTLSQISICAFLLSPQLVLAVFSGLAAVAAIALFTDITIFAGLAVFARLRRLNVNTFGKRSAPSWGGGRKTSCCRACTEDFTD